MSDIKSSTYLELLAGIKQRIRSAQYDALKAVNKELIALYWDIGKSIVEKQQQAGWGKSVVEKLAGDLQAKFPGVRGFSAPNLWLIRQFYAEYQDKEFLQSMIGEKSYKNILPDAKTIARKLQAFTLNSRDEEADVNG